jgi:hypothetical protein
MIEGILAKVDPKKQKNSSVCFEKWYYHLAIMSEMHQKLGTFSWYNPLWTGKIAVTTDERLSKLSSQGDQISKLTIKTINPNFMISATILALLCLCYWKVSPIRPPKKANE